MLTTVGGVSVNHWLPVTIMFAGSSETAYAVSQPVAIYADPGTPVRITSGTSGTTVIDLGISGHLVSLP